MSEGGRSGGRVPALDGLRGLAVLLVVLAHANVPFVRYGGTAGVSVFFVLSGYLITSILLAEHDRSGRVSLGSFYARRALRLVPAMLATVIFGTVAAIVITHRNDPIIRGAIGGMLYISNLQPVIHPLQGGPFGHFWTLAMEEQFYLVWPIAMILAMRVGRRFVIAMAAFLAVISITARFTAPITTHSGYRFAYYMPHTNMYALFLGAISAVVLFGRAEGVAVKPWLWRLGLGMVLFVSVVPGLRGGLYEIDDSTTLVLRVVSGPIAAAGAVVLVIYAARGAWSPPSWLVSRPMVHLGLISYGVYLWHETLDWIIASKVGATGVRGLASGVVALVLAVGMAELSMRYVERPFLLKKKRFEKASLEDANEAEGDMAWHQEAQRS